MLHRVALVRTDVSEELSASSVLTRATGRGLFALKSTVEFAKEQLEYPSGSGDRFIDDETERGLLMKVILPFT
jgi:hypothetical protein